MLSVVFKIDLNRSYEEDGTFYSSSMKSKILCLSWLLRLIQTDLIFQIVFEMTGEILRDEEQGK